MLRCEARFEVGSLKLAVLQHLSSDAGKVREVGAKHISKPKVSISGSLGAPFEVQMSKKCTALWRKARVEIKSIKAHHFRTTFGRLFHDTPQYKTTQPNILQHNATGTTATTATTASATTQDYAATSTASHNAALITLITLQ